MISVASVPAGHPYVHAVSDPEAVALLPDPTPPGATLPGQWWPPRLLEPDYLNGRIDAIDVLHVHFGFESAPPDVLRRVIKITAAHRVPLVLTVHDLQNPHFVDPAEHLARLDVLVPAASAVITLTPGAARAIRTRWGRVATVLPHPHVLPMESVGTPRAARPVPVVGVHAKSLRANIDPLPVIDALLATARPDWLLRVDLDAEAAASSRADILSPARLAAWRDRGGPIPASPTRN